MAPLESVPELPALTGAPPDTRPSERLAGGAELPVSGETEPLVLSGGNLFCVVRRDGNIAPAGARDLGLYHDDTRHLSRLEMRIAGGPPTVLSAESLGSATAQIDLTLSDRAIEEAMRGGAPRDDGFFADPVNSLHLRRRKLLEGREYIERITVTNHMRRVVTVELWLLLEADFADIFEVRGAPRARRGTMLPVQAERDRLEFAYRGLDGATYRTLARLIPEPTSMDGGQPRFRLVLQPGESTTLELIILACREHDVAPPWRPFDQRLAGVNGAHAAFLDGTTRVRCDNNRFEAVLARALSDIDSLRQHVGDLSIIGAGIPWFAAPFGRDALITSLECLAVAPDLARETLRTLAAYQGTRDDPWRDEEPGKILHELRRGEMARAGEVPHSPYYGTIDATPLWLVLLDETWRWTGDQRLIEELTPHAERALGWIDRRLAEGAGLVRYQRTHTRGLANQGWNDSRDGVSFPDGTIAAPPIALIEVQGYTVAALEAMAGLRRRAGDLRAASRLRDRAHGLRRRIEREFWVDATRYYALAIEGSGRRVETISSNPGHLAFCRACLFPQRVNRIAEVLLDEAMNSGWGVRTVARGQAVYNPLSYHNGTVWPHDNALCGYGLAMAGHVRAATTILEGLYAASLHYRDLRLPELFCGMARGDGDSLVHYPVSCSPQAWASGALFLLLQSTLGIRADAEHHRVMIRNPQLPSFLGVLELFGMRVGRSTVSLRFERHGSRTHVDLVSVDGEPGLKVLIEIG